VRLYDIQADPLEMMDLAGDKNRYGEVMKSLFGQLADMQQSMEDPVDITQAFDNFMNEIPPPALPTASGPGKKSARADS
jgi:hypothetical protein